MIYNRINPVGIDYQIQLYQQYLFDALIAEWSILESDYDSYGRAYRNHVGKGYTPEFFVNDDYKKLIFDETLNSVASFFSTSDVLEHKLGFCKQNGAMIFMFNIQRLKQSIVHRADEELKMDVLNHFQQAIKHLKTGKYGCEVTGIETGYKNVFKDFDEWSTNREQLSFSDRHPLYCMKVNLIINYNIHFKNK